MFIYLNSYEVIMRLNVLIALFLETLLLAGCATQVAEMDQDKSLVQPDKEEKRILPEPEQEDIPKKTADEVRTKKWRQVDVPCTGDFFDSHIHFDGLVKEDNEFGHSMDSLTPQELAKRMNENNVGCGVLFVFTYDMNKEFDSMRESLSGLNAGFLPFFIGDESQLSLEMIKNIRNGREGTFFGIGEIGFYQGPLLGTSLAADPWPAIFEYAAKENLFLMLHPTQKQASDLEKMLVRYPNTKVILHGFELLNSGLIEKWLRSYKNLYWTYDLATMFDGFLYRVQNAEDFIKWYEANKKQYLSSVRNKLLPLLEAAPDRVMWGTDIVAAWHVEPEVYNRLMEFSREIVDSLPSQYRANYAHDNAQRIFDSGIIFEPLP